MIKIRFEKREDIFSLSVKGHANFAEAGKDIVCAGVSAILYALIGFLQNNEEHIEDKQIRADSGDAYVFCVGDEKILAAAELALIGFLQIEKQYSEFVSVKVNLEEMKK